MITPGRDNIIYLDFSLDEEDKLIRLYMENCEAGEK